MSAPRGPKSPPLHQYLVQHQHQAGAHNSKPPAKLAGPDPAQQLRSIDTIQRKLLALLYVYVALIVSLYLTYAIVNYYYHHHHQPPPPPAEPHHDEPRPAAQRRAREPELAPEPERAPGPKPGRLEDRIHLLERYIELIALDLEQTKGRLREREKCACSLGCSLNGTHYADKQVWQHKCDTCSCLAGQISCAPRKCPKLAQDCDQAVQLAGQCCPTCMRRCRHQGALVGHGQRVEVAGAGPAKQCKCHDGLIRCEAGRPPAGRQANATLQAYLRLIGGQQRRPA